MSDAREAILTTVRSVTTNASKPVQVPRGCRRVDQRSREQLIELFCERVGDYKAQVRYISGDRLAEEIADAASARGARRIAVPTGIPSSWLASGLEAIRDHGLTAHDLDQVDGALTGCTAAIAETGTIVLSGDAREGRRLLSLVPDLHICVVEEHQIVGLVPEALARLAQRVRESGRPITFISGPSATSDIELQRVEGVHGPRNLVVIVVGQPSVSISASRG
jgi:L-lactate dehydrogenase complex protein LldG